MTRFLRFPVFLIPAFGVLLGGAVPGSAEKAVLPNGDFAGLVDIGGGRRLYLECRGAGSPAVVLEAGYRASARIWSEDQRQSTPPRTIVVTGVAAFTHVCTYDRPGTVAPVDGNPRASRSDPIPQPRTAPAIVAVYTCCLAWQAFPAPTSWTGHSMGGLFVRLYASTYPREIVGLVLVDAYSERLETLLTRERWASLVRLNVRSRTDAVGAGPIP